MKNTINKSIFLLVMAFMALPMMGQDFMNIYFKDGTFRKFYLKNVTEITTSILDADGIQHGNYDYQHVTTIHNKYVYALNDVDSITFTKIDEELAKQNFVSAMPVIFEAISGCESIKDVEDKLDQIKNVDGVADVWSDGHQLYVAIAEDEIYSFHFSHDEKMDTPTFEGVVAQVKALKTQMNSIVKQKGEQLKVVIANQQDKDKDRNGQRDSYFSPLIKYLRECDANVKYLEEPKVDFFYDNSEDPNDLHFYDYDVVLLSTHGGYGPIYYNNPKRVNLFTGEVIPRLAEGIKGHSFETAEDITFIDKDKLGKNWWEDNYNVFKEWRDNKVPLRDITDVHINYTFQLENRDGDSVYVAHPELTEYFFRDIAPGEFKNSKSFFFNVACQSLKGENNQPSYSFANILLNKKNLGVYAGYTESNRFGQKTGYYLLYYMLQGGSINRSYNLLPAYCQYETLNNIGKYTYGTPFVEPEQVHFLIDEYLYYQNDGMDNAELKIFDKTGSTPDEFFLYPTTTIEIDDNFINREYASKQTVTIEGYVTYLDVSNIETGFEIGDNPELGREYGIHESIKKEIVNNEYGNYRIELTVPNLIPEKTYYYRAYTYDGMNYNYGKTDSFKIKKPQVLGLSTNSISLNVGESKNVQITSGSGSYLIGFEDANDEFVATAYLDGNTISINALNPGEATITVSDMVSGQTQTIMVTVTGQADTRELMVTKTVNKTVYSLYKKTLDENNYRTNPDGWRCYRSELVLDIIKDGRTESYVIDNNIYLDKKNSHHTGQHPCLLLDFNKNMIGVFCNSKESGNNYDMDGYYYYSSMGNISFSKETVFEGYNWGWFPYFRDYGDGNINLCNFSYDGYFTILAVRASGSWKLYYDNKEIGPDVAQQIWERIGSVLVIGKNQDDEVDERIHALIPDEIRDVIDEYIPIYDGMNPPNIEGSYFLSPQTMIGSSLSYDQIGKEYNPEYQKYGNQDMVNNTIDMVRVSVYETDWSKGSGAFISGTGNNFTIFFDQVGESYETNEAGEGYTIPYKWVYIVSGKKTATGIKDLTVGFVMKEKGYDPEEKIVDVGTFRFFTDQDGMSEATSWPYGNQYGAKKRVKQGRTLPSILDNNREKLTPLK